VNRKPIEYLFFPEGAHKPAQAARAGCDDGIGRGLDGLLQRARRIQAEKVEQYQRWRALRSSN